VKNDRRSFTAGIDVAWLGGVYISLSLLSSTQNECRTGAHRDRGGLRRIAPKSVQVELGDGQHEYVLKDLERKPADGRYERCTTA
jgi:hypothetical protein